MIDAHNRRTTTWNIVGPVVLSALSLFLSFHLLQLFAYWLDPSFDLLASRGLGKAAFTTMAFFQLLLFLAAQPGNLLGRCWSASVSFFAHPRWLVTFFKFFVPFALLHASLLALFVAAGYAEVNPVWHLLNGHRLSVLVWGLFVTFMLAWTEELIFRGTIYLYFLQYYSTLMSIFVASFIFMFCHFLSNPLTIVGHEWQIALGLFLLGFLLNTVFAVTGTLPANMGVHAGLVYIKVILRKLPLLTFLPASQLPLWVDSDLRKSLLVHVLFALTIFLIAFFNKEKLIKRA